MSQIIPIYIPTYISSVDYQPARVLPRLLYYNGAVQCEPYYINDLNGGNLQYSQFPYFDNYRATSGSQFPTTGSKSLLFFNEEGVYGQTPTGSLYTEYWEDYVELLYNPRTRLINASAIIPLADYFDMELNDLVEFRGNYYHLRAINEYNLKNGECKLQLLGPILPQALPFAQDAVPFVPPANPCCTPTITDITENAGNVEIAFTLPAGDCLSCSATTVQLSTDGINNWYGNNTSGCTSPRVLTAPTSSVYYRITQICEGSVESTPSNAVLFVPTTTTTTTTTTTSTTTTTTTTAASATLAWSFSETGGAFGQMDLYVNGNIIESRSNTSSGTYTVYVGDTINVQVTCDTCGEPDNYSNVYCTGIITDADCGVSAPASIFTAVYTVVSGDVGTTLNLDNFAGCDGGCL